eukprot:231483-Rhodomonas_salina.1
MTSTAANVEERPPAWVDEFAEKLAPMLELRVVGTDIRQDGNQPYSFFVVQARFGDIRWTVEKLMHEFYSFDDELRRILGKERAAYLPRLPPRNRVKNWLGSVSNEQRMQELDEYMREMTLHLVSCDLAVHARCDAQL